MAEAENADNTEQKAGGSRKKLIIIIAVVAVLLLGGGGAAAYFLLAGDTAPAPAEAAPVKKPDAIYTKIRTLEGRPMFVVTLKSKNEGRHYMQVYVEAKSREPKVDEALTKHMPLIVARLNALFSTQEFETVMTIEGKRALRQQATELVQGIMQEKIGEPGVETILFTNLVMQ